MELKEYITIFKKHFKLFLLMIFLVTAAIIVFQIVRPLTYKTSLALNITRDGSQKTDDYKYDDFYRLQADERFADTVVRWMALPAITESIYSEAGVSEGEKFKAKRLSSQLIEITYITSDVKTAQKLSDSIIKVLNRETEKLNEFQKNEAWFKILGGQPIITDNKPNLWKSAPVGLLIGVFLGFWTVIIKHYLE